MLTITLLVFYSASMFVSINGNDCIVDDMEVQADFDTDRYMGKWYEYKWYASSFIPPEERYENYYHYYIPTDDKNITNYISGRDPSRPDGECFFYNRQLIPTAMPGKFIWQDTPASAVPYWVLETDYTHYAFVYGCSNITANRTCAQPRAWIWSRTQTIPQIIMDRATSFFNRTCLAESSFLDTKQDNECDVPAQYKTTEGQNCNVSTFQVQQDFDIAKYSGSWYEMEWLAQSYIPPSELFQDYQHEYIAGSDGKVSAFIRGRNKQGCFYREAIMEPLETPGKFTLKVKDSNDQYPYWVVDTDYSGFAVMYGCLEVNNSQCVSARSTVWSRRQTLAPRLQSRSNTVVQMLCVNPAAFLLTSHKNACPPYFGQSTCEPVSDKGESCAANIYLLVSTMATMFFINWRRI
ncbi:uncharacterized protein LOC124272880 [Haliotis rubra]|uniref:uncharacterized protein LOC124272880 n=2 Tax=Haliotis rubra TaxID=36100 RepID=UPI001EE5F377|nr:uncharacterized protein LOC124272880 [Haliotis rubra]